MKPVKISVLITIDMDRDVAVVHPADVLPDHVSSEVQRWLAARPDHPRAADVRLWLERYDAQQPPKTTALPLMTDAEARSKPVREARTGLKALGLSPEDAAAIVQQSVRKRLPHMSE